MNQRSSASARILAVSALIVAFVVAIVLIGSAIGGDSDGSGERTDGDRSAQEGGGANRDAPASYVVESGDTLTSIARETGVSVVRIQTLNPEVDPQILIAGEKLKLR